MVQIYKKTTKLLHIERKLHIKSLFYGFFMVIMQFEMNNYKKIFIISFVIPAIFAIFASSNLRNLREGNKR